MENYESWMLKLQTLCHARGLGEPTYQDVSDRRGGRTAWSTVVVIRGATYPARFWYDGAYLDQARQDAAEVAHNTITAGITTNPPLSANSYAAHTATV